MQTLRRILTTSLGIPRKVFARAPGCAAPFSASGFNRTALPDSATLDLLSEQLKRDFDFYSEHTRDPIFKILPRNDGIAPTRDGLSTSRISEHEYTAWADSLRNGSFSDVAHRIGQTGMRFPYFV